MMVRGDAPRQAELICAEPQAGWSRRQLYCSLIALCIVWLAAFGQWALRDMVVPWDSKNQFYAFFRFMASAIAQGGTPFWNPFHYAGHPSIADPQSLIFAAPFLVWAFVWEAPSMLAFDAFVFAHLLAGGAAIIWHGRDERWHPAAAILAASVFMLGGAVSGRMNHVGIVCVYGLFPIAYMFMRRALERNSWIAGAAFAFVSSQIVLGRSQTALLLCAALLMLFVGHVCVQASPLRFLRARIGLLLAAAALALALAAIPVLLSLQFMLLSNRPSTSIDLALGSSLHPLNLSTFFSANVFGSLSPGTMGWGPSADTLPGSDLTDRAFNYLFAGSLTGLLLVWHGVAGGRLIAPGRRIWTLLLVFCLAYALGRFTPLYPWLFEHAPGVSLFRRPNDAMFLVSLALSYLVGWLASDYVRKGLPATSKLILAPLLSCIVVLAFAAVDFAQSAGQAASTLAALGASALVYCGLALALARPCAERTRSLMLVALVGVTAAELVWRNAGSVLNAEPAAHYALLEAPRGEDARVLKAIKADMAHNAATSHRPRIEVLGLDGPWQNASMILGLEAINGYNPLRIGEYDRLVAPGESPHDVTRRVFTKSFPSYHCPLSRRLGLRYLVLDKPISHLSGRHDARQFTALVEGPRAWVYRFDDIGPAVRISSQVKVAVLEQFGDNVGALLEPGSVIVDSEEPLSQAYASRRPGALMATIASWRPDRVEIDVHTSEAAVVTLNAPYYPGWEVEVDGKKSSIIKADVLFRGVEAPPGARRIVFHYRPLSIENLFAAFSEVFLE